MTQIAVAIIRLASTALWNVPSLVIYPAVTSTFVVALMVYWVLIAAFVASAGDSISAGTVMQSANSLVEKTTGSSLLCAFNATSGGAAANSSFCAIPASAQSYEVKNVAQYMLIYHFFGLLWTNQFIVVRGTVLRAGHPKHLSDLTRVCTVPFPTQHIAAVSHARISFVYRGFHPLLCTQAFGMTVIAGAIGQYYFTKNKKAIPRGMMCRSWWRTFR